MYRVTVKFNGRRAGANGITYAIEDELLVDSTLAVRPALYEGNNKSGNSYEHISMLTMVPYFSVESHL